jgi:phage baseplate assembly protein W
MSGFGSAPFGSSGVGLSVPVEAADPPEGPAGSRFINAATRDYEIDSDTGQQKQMPVERQQVLLALTTLYGSASANPTFGVKLPRKMGDRFPAEMANAVRAALAHLTDVQKVIRIDSVTVKRGLGGRSLTTVTYSILRTGKVDVVTL